MKTKCPSCLAAIDLNDVLLENEQRAILQFIAFFEGAGTGVASLAMAYAEACGCLPIRRVRKTRLILEEIKRLFDAGSFRHGRQTYEISRAGIIEALGVVVHRHFEQPLDGHGYLKKVMVGIAEKTQKVAARQDEQGLRTREEALRSGVRTDEVGGGSRDSARNIGRYVPVDESDDEASYPADPEEARRHIQNIVSGIGRKMPEGGRHERK